CAPNAADADCERAARTHHDSRYAPDSHVIEMRLSQRRNGAPQLQFEGTDLEYSTTEVLTMAQAITHTHARVWTGNPAYQAYQILHVAFILAPVIAGVDKFTHLLCNWDKYLAPSVARMMPVDAHTFMMGVGVIEIIAALIVAVWPMVGAYIVAIWLWSII